MTTRVKVLARLLALAGISALAYLLIRAEGCRRTIAEQSIFQRDTGGGEKGLSCSWRIGRNKPTPTTPTLWQIVCGARPVQVWLNNPGSVPPVNSEQARKMAEALRFFGSLEVIGVQGSGNEAMDVFMGVGHQPKLTEAYSFRCPITDEVNGALCGFPRLRHLAISNSDYSGRRFPYLPELETADFQGSPITLDGLAAIADSPKLRLIVVSYVDLTELQFQAIREIQAKHPQLKGLEFDPPKQKEPE